MRSKAAARVARLGLGSGEHALGGGCLVSLQGTALALLSLVFPAARPRPKPAFAPCPHPFPFGTAAIPRPNRPRPPARGAAARRRATLAAGRRLHSCVRGPRRSKRTAGASRRFPPSFPSRPSMQARPAGSTVRSCLVRRPCVALVCGGRRGGAARAWGGRHGVLLLLPLVGVALLFVASRPTPFVVRTPEGRTD